MTQLDARDKQAIKGMLVGAIVVMIVVFAAVVLIGLLVRLFLFIVTFGGGC